ncbi:MAG: hypothetical protein ACTSYC_04445 [Promethearchaeota archaeon]
MNEVLIELKNDKFLLENEEKFSLDLNSNENIEENLNFSEISIPFTKFITKPRKFMFLKKNSPEFKKILFQELKNLENLDLK